MRPGRRPERLTPPEPPSSAAPGLASGSPERNSGDGWLGYAATGPAEQATSLAAFLSLALSASFLFLALTASFRLIWIRLSILWLGFEHSGNLFRWAPGRAGQ